MVDRGKTMRALRRLPPSVGLAVAAAALLAPGPAPAQNALGADPLYDLVMMQESIIVCGFALPEPAASKVEAAILDNAVQEGQNAADVAALRDQIDFQLAREKRTLCDPNGSWKATFDRNVAIYMGADR